MSNSNLNNINLCDHGKQQSPINIETAKLLNCNKRLCDLTFYYRIQNVCEIIHEDNKVIVNMDKSNNYVIYNLIKYTLDKVTFHTPSLHSVDDLHTDGEMVLYHKSPHGSVLAISVLLNINEEVTVNSRFFDMFMHFLPKPSDHRKLIDMTGKNWNIFYGLPKNKDFFSYEGSLIEGKCSEGVSWIVLKYPVHINRVTYDRLIQVNHPKPKSCKRLFDRTVYFTSNQNTYNFKTPIENCKPNTKVIEHNKNKINQTQQEIEDYCKLHKTKQNCNSSTLHTVPDVCKWQDSHNLVLNDYDDNVKNTDTNELLIQEQDKLKNLMKKSIASKNKLIETIVPVLITIIIGIVLYIVITKLMKKKLTTTGVNNLTNNIMSMTNGVTKVPLSFGKKILNFLKNKYVLIGFGLIGLIIGGNLLSKKKINENNKEKKDEQQNNLIPQINYSQSNTVVGGVLLVGLIAVIIYFVTKKKSSKMNSSNILNNNTIRGFKKYF